MKTQKSLSILMPLAVAAMVLVGCSDYDNGYTEKEMKFNADFTREFGSFDETQDWNLAERANVTVNTSELKDINVYTEKEGIFVQVGAFKNVSGTRKLEFDVIEDMNNLVVSDGDVALRAVVGGIVDFDNMSSMTAVEMGTRGNEYVDRNLWSRDYVVPANITEAESLAVVAEFSKQHYGAFNEVLVPWTELFVQQVHKGQSRYVDGFKQGTGVASDKMNHLLIWNSAAGEGSFNGGYVHVNDFNSGDHHAVGIDEKTGRQIIGLTLMRGINPDDCPTEDVTINGETKHWVKQFCYHNTQSDEYQPTYIMKHVSWVEDGVTKSGLYLGFDFYAQKRPDQPADKNMDVARDWIFNDWIIKISQGLDVSVPVSELQNAEPAAWILAGEDLGGGFDIDYNDVVVKVEPMAGENMVKVIPLAAGGTLASYLFFGTTCIGEIHQLLDAAPARSGSYQPINLGGDLHEPTQSKELHVAQDWSLTQDISKANNMGGFTIRVLPAGTEPKAKTLNYDDPAFGNATTVKAPQQGEAPYIICVPYAYKLTNYPEPGLSEATVWEWPNERINIAEVYEEFEAWAHDKGAKKDWYTKPVGKGFVNTMKFTRKSFGVQPAKMTDFAIQETGNPTADLTIYNKVPSVYPEQPVPVATLTLKEGVTSVDVVTGDEIDVLDYVNVSAGYLDKVFGDAPNPDIMESVSGSLTKFKCVKQRDNPGTTTINVILSTPTKILIVPLTINYNKISGTSSEDSNKQDNNIVLYDNGTAIYNIPTIAAGETKTYTITSNGSGSYSVVDSEFFTASVSGNTLTITGVKAGQANLILTQAADDTYKAATGTYWLTTTGAQQTGGDSDGDEGDDVDDVNYLDKSKQNAYVFTVESDGDGTYTIKYGEKELKTHATSLTLNWNDLDDGATNFVIHSLSSWKLNKTLPWSVTGSDTLNANELEAIKNDGGSFQATCWNGKKFYLSVQ